MPQTEIGAARAAISIVPARMRRQRDRRVLMATMLIDTQFDRDLHLADLAQMVGLSPGRFAHLFKEETGESPQGYLNRVRLERARQHLESGVLSVKEIARLVGIPNVSRLCRNFKAQHKLTPKEYRKAHFQIDLRRAGSELSLGSRKS